MNYVAATKVSNVRVTSVGTDYVSIVWDVPTDAQVVEYEVKYWIADAVVANTSSLFGNRTNATIAGVAQQSKYTFLVSCYSLAVLLVTGRRFS